MESTYDVYVDSNASAHKTRPIWSFVSPSLTMVVAIFLISYCCCCKGKKSPTCSRVRYLPNCMRKEFQKKTETKQLDGENPAPRDGVKWKGPAYRKPSRITYEQLRLSQIVSYSIRQKCRIDTQLTVELVMVFSYIDF